MSVLFPLRAKEVMTGSLNAVPKTGVAIIEATSEGPAGEFYDVASAAQAKAKDAEPLSELDFAFFFYPWWKRKTYRIDPKYVAIDAKQHEYFEAVEQEMDCKIDAGQRAWYVATMSADFSGAEEKMWQEYPSTPDEAFQVSTKGNYYAKDLVKLRKRGGITSVPVLDLPVYTFWDIGNKDGCAVWFMQELRGEARFINYYEEHLEDLRHYVAHLQDLGYLYGAHFLPHDADHKRLGDFNKSTKQQLQDLMPGQTFWIVPRITELMAGINATRKHLFQSTPAIADGRTRGRRVRVCTP